MAGAAWDPSAWGGLDAWGIRLANADGSGLTPLTSAALGNNEAPSNY